MIIDRLYCKYENHKSIQEYIIDIGYNWNNNEKIIDIKKCNIVAFDLWDHEDGSFVYYDTYTDDLIDDDMIEDDPIYKKYLRIKKLNRILKLS